MEIEGVNGVVMTDDLIEKIINSQQEEINKLIKAALELSLSTQDMAIKGQAIDTFM